MRFISAGILSMVLLGFHIRPTEVERGMNNFEENVDGTRKLQSVACTRAASLRNIVNHKNVTILLIFESCKCALCQGTKILHSTCSMVSNKVHCCRRNRGTVVQNQS